MTDTNTKFRCLHFSNTGDKITVAELIIRLFWPFGLSPAAPSSTTVLLVGVICSPDWMSLEGLRQWYSAKDQYIWALLGYKKYNVGWGWGPMGKNQFWECWDQEWEEPWKQRAVYPKKHTIASLSGEGNGTPLQDSCLENPMDGGAC